MAPIRLKEVDAGNSKHAALLHWMQLEVMPLDVPADTQRGFWWVAFEGDRPAAFCGMYDSEDANSGYLCRAGVLPAFRGRQLQRRMIDARVRKAKSLGYTACHTDTIPGNPASSNNLIACGFRMFNPEDPWVGPNACYWIKHFG